MDIHGHTSQQIQQSCDDWGPWSNTGHRWLRCSCLSPGPYDPWTRWNRRCFRFLAPEATAMVHAMVKAIEENS